MRINSGSSGGRMKDEWNRLVHEVMIEQMFYFGKGEKSSKYTKNRSKSNKKYLYILRGSWFGMMVFGCYENKLDA